MKRSEFVKKVLNSYDNGMFVNGEQVRNAIELFEKMGMLPPLNSWSLHTDGDHADPDNILYYTWEEEDENI